MILREVTIGRSNNCDIYLDSRCRYASNLHGTIYYDGNQLMFKDTSTNGTMINNVNVHKRAIPINRGDVIMIAGQYPLSWNQIDSFFRDNPNRRMDTQIALPSPVTPTNAQQPNVSKWNWGAFLFTWIWGLFNGCWWLLPIFLVIGLLMLIPIVNIFAYVLQLVLCIICGVKGTEYAWRFKNWNSVEEFEHTQKVWAKAGIIWFCISIAVSFVITLIIIFSIANGL